MDHTPTHQDPLSVAETAKVLSRSTEQVRRYLREGRLQGRRIGGQWFIDAAAVEAFSASQTKDDPFLKTLRTASRSKPLDAVIGIGSGPGSDIVNGIASYRADSVRRNRGVAR